MKKNTGNYKTEVILTPKPPAGWILPQRSEKREEQFLGIIATDRYLYIIMEQILIMGEEVFAEF